MFSWFPVSSNLPSQSAGVLAAAATLDVAASAPASRAKPRSLREAPARIMCQRLIIGGDPLQRIRGDIAGPAHRLADADRNCLAPYRQQVDLSEREPVL